MRINTPHFRVKFNYMQEIKKKERLKALLISEGLFLEKNKLLQERGPL